MEEAFGQIEDPNQIMKEARDQIVSESRTDEGIITALEIIDKSCDDPDCARNAEKLDVLQPLLDLLNSHRGAIRIRTLEILALLCSNNPNIQEACDKRGAMDLLLNLCKDSAPASEERSKSFRALVAFVRNLEELEKRLLQEERGKQLLTACLAPEELPGTREKAMSFIRSLVDNSVLDAENAAPLAAGVAKLFETAQDGSIQYKETLASCACQLAQNFKAQCSPEFREAVEKRLKCLTDAKDAEAQDELTLMLECLKALRG
eukprot:TRINITY_DN70140_c0_g1_i1.p1 TRINITY_DN70140_c0_g1~~TRINITY_DN70140_c0_g1_i1.p1  ORF type:complete len:308 (+),score=80.58 TRINITY_DN70140_c0_g1_i1:141-926(+)